MTYVTKLIIIISYTGSDCSLILFIYVLPRHLNLIKASNSQKLGTLQREISKPMTIFVLENLSWLFYKQLAQLTCKSLDYKFPLDPHHGIKYIVNHSFKWSFTFSSSNHLTLSNLIKAKNLFRNIHIHFLAKMIIVCPLLYYEVRAILRQSCSCVIRKIITAHATPKHK